MQPGGEDILNLLATDLDRNFERLVTLFWHQLKVFVLRKISNSQDAEDIVQEAFVRGYYALMRYTSQQILTLKVRPWLYKITWHVCCNYVSRSKAPPAISLDLPDEGGLLDCEDDVSTQPEELFERMEQRHELETLVASLPPNYRMVVSMYFFDELSQREIAEILGFQAGTVKVYVHRGVGLLRKMAETHIFIR